MTHTITSWILETNHAMESLVSQREKMGALLWHIPQLMLGLREENQEPTKTRNSPQS